MSTLDLLRSVAGRPRVEGRMIGSPCKDRADPGKGAALDDVESGLAKHPHPLGMGQGAMIPIHPRDLLERE